MTSIEIRDVGPRDGLQDHKAFIQTSQKLAMIERLIATGIRSIEATSFVSPKVIPQLADAADLFDLIGGIDTRGTNLSVFVATRGWLEKSLAHPVSEISTAVPATDGMSEANFRRGTSAMLDEVAAMRRDAPHMPMSATIAVAFGCPFDGAVSVDRVLHLADSLASAGYERILLGDTIGVGNPTQVTATVSALVKRFPEITIGGHFHDARGAAVANVVAAVEAGATMIDASLAGMGGCPFAPGAAGNVATEDVVWVLEGMGYSTGVDLEGVTAASRWLGGAIDVSLNSRTPQHHRFDWEEPARAVVGA